MKKNEYISPLSMTTKQLQEDHDTNLSKALETSNPEMVSVEELGKEIKQKDNKYLNELFICVERGKKEHEGDFYIEVITLEEKIYRHVYKPVIRNRFLHRASCPTPTYDSAVFKYTHANESLDLIWQIPGKVECSYVRDNLLEFPSEYKQLISYILDFEDGTLLKKAKLLNNEHDVKTGIIIKAIHE